jgi:beta-fructofuranosidase
VPDVHYQHPGTWFGDCMPLYARNAFQLFHQRDTRRPGPFGEPFGWALARTTDFVTYEDLGEVLLRGADDEQDQFIFAGSVFEARGRFFAMYTGFNRDFPAQDRPAQVLMLATSDDLVTWTKTGRQVVAPQPGYDPDNWRDPFVLYDDEAGHWLMVLGGRLNGDLVRSGRTVWLTSTDLETWEFRGDFWAPDLYSMHEMPDLFRMGDWWYLLTTEYSDRSKTIYRMSRSLHGPWSAPVDDAFDGRTYYAARSASDGEHRYLFGWVPTKEGEHDRGSQQWGGTLVVHQVVQRPDGSLGVAPAPGIANRFATQPVNALSDEAQPAAAGTGTEIRLARADGATSASFAAEPGPVWQLTAWLTIAEGTRSVALRFAEEASTGDAYAFTLRPGERLIAFDKVPNYPWFRYDARGHDRPWPATTGGRHRLRLIVDGDLATLYLDDLALSARFHDRRGHGIGMEVIDGAATLGDVTITQWPERV